MKSSAYYFHMKTNVLADFEICISVPLNGLMRRQLTDLNFIVRELIKMIPSLLTVREISPFEF